MEYKSSNLLLYTVGISVLTLMAMAIVQLKPLIGQTETVKVSGVVDRIGSDDSETVLLLKDNQTIFTMWKSERTALTKSGDTVEFTINSKDKLLEARERINREKFVNLTLREERKLN